MALLWNPQAEIDRWLQVEVAQMGRVQGIRLATLLIQVGAPSWTSVHLWERETKHDVVAFLHALDERIQRHSEHWLAEESADPLDGDLRRLRQWLHYGLTSSDVIDTGLGLALRASHSRLAHLANRTVGTLAAVIALLKPTRSVIGRTHGQWAVPMPAGHRWQVLWEMLVGTSSRFADLQSSVSVGKLSGPVGVNDPSLADQWGALIPLELETVESTQVVPRDGLAAWAQSAAQLATVCEAIATQIWLLAQEGIAEVSEGLADGQVGSSAMPHKANPVCSENIRGLARLARMDAEVLQLGAVQWGEHDLAHSSVERVALPDLCHLVATILVRTDKLLSGLQFHGQPVPDSYVNTHEQLMQLQREGVPYVEAHERIRSGSYPDGKIDTGTPCGYGDMDCGIRGGSARCGGCKQ
jgi:adenylosuccinate lyase